MLARRCETIFGWPLHITTSPNKRTLYNFPVQGGGAEMLRLAAWRLCEAGLVPYMLVHDGILFEAGEPGTVAQAMDIMRSAGRDVCHGLEIGVDVDQRLEHGARYRDKRPWQRRCGRPSCMHCRPSRLFLQGPCRELRDAAGEAHRGRDHRDGGRAAQGSKAGALRDGPACMGRTRSEGHQNPQGARLDTAAAHRLEDQKRYLSAFQCGSRKERSKPGNQAASAGGTGSRRTNRSRAAAGPGASRDDGG